MAKKKQRENTAWNAQAASYDQRHGEQGDVHHQQVIIPAVLRHLCRSNPQSVIDCCCGQGVVARAMSQQGMQVCGVDGSQEMIDAANARKGDQEEFHCADAHDIDQLLTDICVDDVVGVDNSEDSKSAKKFDAAIIIMALQDLNPFTDVLKALRNHLHKDASCIAVLTHPCFRIPQHSTWHFDRAQETQWRQISSYMSEQELRIEHRQGNDQQSQVSHSYHRPISQYIRAFAQAGMPLIDCEELCTPKRGTDGNRSVAEDHAAREIPMFMLLHGRCL
ncbi:MAG: class I SAM-dependent methyltransferase [Planctomycetes bacterium]|nr:class I SAM-dependent methyltransferase [Planctomycetota bacterium]